MILTGIGDEAATELQGLIQAIQKLGWKHIELRTVEVPGFPKANFHDISDQAFDQAVGVLEANSIGVYCFSSTIMNWSRHLDEPFGITLAEVGRAIPRMQRLRARFVRIMSFKPRDEEYSIPSKVFRRVNEVTKRFLDAGLQPVHENCMNYGGMSWQHALELLDRCPGLKWVFDTANPIFNPDRSRAKPWPRQDVWEFWTHIREHVGHLHIKDASWNAACNDADYRWPGEGSGRVRDILKDALERAQRSLQAIRDHWASSENGSHYRRDVSLGEDASRISGKSGAYVMATLRNLLLGLMELHRDRGRTKACTFPKWRRKLTNSQKIQLLTGKI